MLEIIQEQFKKDAKIIIGQNDDTKKILEQNNKSKNIREKIIKNE